MKCVIQRVRRASVSSVVAGGDPRAPIVRAIGPGLAVLAGFEHADTEDDRRWCAAKIAGLRVFEDEAGKMNRSVAEMAAASGAHDAGILLVPNFTLAADCRKGRRPGFDNAMEPALAAPHFERFVEDVKRLAEAVSVERGEFRATMLVTIENDGPVTLILDSRSAGG